MLFIIYLDGAMEDLEALNRRSKLPMRIVLDRPREQHAKLLRGEVKKGEEPYGEIQEIREIKDAAINKPTQEGRKITRAEKKKRKQLSEAYQRRQREEQDEEQKSGKRHGGRDSRHRATVQRTRKRKNRAKNRQTHNNHRHKPKKDRRGIERERNTEISHKRYSATNRRHRRPDHTERHRICR